MALDVVTATRRCEMATEGLSVLRSAMDLVARCRDEFAGRPVWLFSSGPVGKPSGGLARQMYTDPVELPLLRDATGFREHRIFPGKLIPKTLPFAQRASLLVFRGLAGH